jgi:hypothetical protein
MPSEEVRRRDISPFPRRRAAVEVEKPPGVVRPGEEETPDPSSQRTIWVGAI